jgi:hypothetical protein
MPVGRMIGEFLTIAALFGTLYAWTVVGHAVAEAPAAGVGVHLLAEAALAR